MPSGITAFIYQQLPIITAIIGELVVADLIFYLLIILARSIATLDCWFIFKLILGVIFAPLVPLWFFLTAPGGDCAD